MEGGAIARLYFRKKTLQWSFVSSENLNPPILVTFGDSQDNIIEELQTPITDLYNRFRYRHHRPLYQVQIQTPSHTYITGSDIDTITDLYNRFRYRHHQKPVYQVQIQTPSQTYIPGSDTDTITYLYTRFRYRHHHRPI